MTTLETLFAQIDNLNNDEFEVIIDHIDKQKKRRARDILVEAQRQASRFVADLDARGVKVRKSGASQRPPKYVNPQNPQQTWSGFGRLPEWVKAHLESGGKKEDLAIK